MDEQILTDRDSIFQFIQLYERYIDAGFRINDIDPATRTVEIVFLDGSGIRKWYDYWDAAKVVEAIVGSVPDDA